VAELDEGGSEASLQYSIDEASGTLKLSLIGELDLSSVATLTAAIEPLMARNPTRIVFDLAELRFMDSSGIALLVSLTERSGSVEVRNPSLVVQRMIELTGLSTILRIAP